MLILMLILTALADRTRPLMLILTTLADRTRPLMLILTTLVDRTRPLMLILTTLADRPIQLSVHQYQWLGMMQRGPTHLRSLHMYHSPDVWCLTKAV